MHAMNRTRHLVLVLVVGVALLVFGILDELTLAFVKEGCRIGNAEACANVRLTTIHAHGSLLAGVVAVAFVMFRFAKRGRG